MCRYALVGRNGVGKTTLLTRLAAGDIRGYPTHLKCIYVKHEVLSERGETVVEFMREVAKGEDGVCHAF
jgi:ATPase subunit of ABC transporter with duplicated ATPase domains